MGYRYMVKDFREAVGMTQEELSAKSGISRSIISGLEQGEIKITKSSTLINLANALGKTVGEIFLQE